MNIFKRLFGKTEKPQATTTNKKSDKQVQDEIERIMSQMSNSANTPEQFKIELYDALNRYYSSPDLQIELNLVDKQGNQVEEHIGLNHTFSQWRVIQSPWDRRSILFDQFDKTEFKKLEKWQIIERFVKDRYAIKALEFQKNDIINEDFKDIRLFVAFSKLYRVMDDLDRAKQFANHAYELRPDLDIVKVEYANVLHLTGSEEEKQDSHKLIQEIITKHIEASNTKEVALLNFFLFSNNYLDSSVFALSFLQQGDCDIDTWEKVAEEYYWCPLFRYEHAVYLSKKGEWLRASAKLNSLANEFPWFKAGVHANIDAINQLRKQGNDPNFMQEEMEKMENYKKLWKSN